MQQHLDSTFVGLHICIIRDERKYLKKEEDNLARERIDQAGVAVGGGLPPPPPHGRDFWDFWYQKQLF